jgi:hypothetical protein
MLEILAKNQVEILPEKAEVMQSQIGDIKTAQIALSTKKIESCSEKEISKMLKVLFLMVGIRNKHLPDKVETDFLLLFIKRNYAKKTMDEFLLAFNLALNGMLDLHADDVKVFDVFSCEYLSRIMNGYRHWLKRVMKDKETLSIFNVPQKLLEPQKELSAKEWKQWIEDSKHLPFALIPSVIYDHLLKNKKIKLSEKEKTDYKDMAIRYHTSTLTLFTKEFTEFTEMKKTGEYSDKVRNRLKVIFKQLVVHNKVYRKDVKELFTEKK